MSDEPRKRIVVDPNFLKLPMRGNRTRKNNATEAKPIKIRAEKKDPTEKTLKRRAIQYIRKQQEERYKRLTKGLDEDNATEHKVEITGGKSYADEFKSDFDDSLAFLQKLTDQTSQKIQNSNATLKQYPVTPNSTLFQSPILDKVLDNNIDLGEMPESKQLPHFEPNAVNRPVPATNYPANSMPTYGCLKGGKLPTYRTLKTYSASAATPNTNLGKPLSAISTGNVFDKTEPTRPLRLTPEQQRAELKHFLEKRKEEKQRVERVKRQQHLVNPSKKQKRTTIRTFRVGKSKIYPRVGVLIPNRTIRTQVLEKKQKIRETPIEDIRKYLIKTGLIRVGSSCPNDVLRKMYESSMMMCGEIQNHNPDNLLYNYLHNGL